MNVNCFLGANSCVGFYSLYDGFCRGKGDFLHLIKAGPGGGKSGFMRRIALAAAEHGYDTECVLCSGDPDSLDAVYIPEKRIGFMDATAPHACEPSNFAHDSDYVNLGAFCEQTHDPKIEQLTDEYRAMYKVAYSYLAAAGEIERAEIPGLITDDVLEKVRKRAQSAAVRELGSAKGRENGACVKECFARCISCKGELMPRENPIGLCERIYLLDDNLGLAGAYIKQMLTEVQARGEKIVLCQSPLCPEKSDALLLPEHGLGFVSSSAAEGVQPWRHVRLDALVPPDAVRAVRGKLRQRKKLSRCLINEAVCYLGMAKAKHDELERAYNPHVDFASLNAFADEVTAKLFK